MHYYPLRLLTGCVMHRRDELLVHAALLCHVRVVVSLLDDGGDSPVIEPQYSHCILSTDTTARDPQAAHI
jgi:hypothetical protein